MNQYLVVLFGEHHDVPFIYVDRQLYADPGAARRGAVTFASACGVEVAAARIVRVHLSEIRSKLERPNKCLSH